MRKLLVIPGLLFGLLFGSGGYLIFSQTALPMWQNWQRMQDWRPGSARLLSFSTAGNDTRASYRYEYAGASFRGKGVGVSEISDNIGSYQHDMQAYLRRISRSREALPIWVNPGNPSESVIDRDMRWGLFTLSAGFCSLFLLVGGVAIYGCIRGAGKDSARRPSLMAIRKAWQQALQGGSTNLGFIEFCRQHFADPRASSAASIITGLPVDWQSRKGWETAQIRSDASKGAWLFWLSALVWNAISSPVLFILPAELDKENYAALVALLFPVVGVWLLYRAINLTLEYRRFGRVRLKMDPYPGGIGGHVGGSIQVKNLDYRRASETTNLQVTLECVYSYISGSGKNRSRRESIKWAERGRPGIDNSIAGVSLSFRFDVPQGLPPADVEQSGAYHCWRLSVEADIPGIDLQRRYNIPVFATGATSRGVSHDISARVAAANKQESDAARLAINSGNFEIDGLSRSMRVRSQGNLLQLRFPMFRNKFLTLFAALFAVGFGFASYSMIGMVSGGGAFGIFVAVFSIPFLLTALLAAIATVYLLFNNLRVDILPGEVSVLRRLLFLPVYRRHLRRQDISHLGIKRSGSTGQGVDRIQHFKVQAEDQQGRSLAIAEDIDGEDVATHLRDYLALRIGVAVK
jgi:hypothetical protein